LISINFGVVMHQAQHHTEKWGLRNVVFDPFVGEGAGQHSCTTAGFGLSRGSEADVMPFWHAGTKEGPGVWTARPL